ncbi:MAG: LamG domain-containing protein, partial [Deltaproteobacteria bacterium]|nr:LamG domain-containing protein [Deltaproteobacteria bacterium]
PGFGGGATFRRDGAGGGPTGAGAVGGSARPGGLLGHGSGTRGADGMSLPGEPIAKAAADRAHELPDAREHREKVQRDVAVEPPQSGDPDLLLSVPFNGAVDTEAGVPPVSAEGLTVGQDGTVQFGDESMVQFQTDGNFNGEAGSIGFSITPDWSGNDPTNQSFVQVLSGDNVWENRLSLVKNYNNLRFILVDDTGVERNVGLEINDWAPGEPHHVTATWGDAQMSLYVDGRLVGQQTYEGTLRVPSGAPIYLGYNRPGGTYVGPGGAISDFKIYGRSLDQAEIGQ